MSANLIKTHEAIQPGMPLDLGPLLAPYQHYTQLSIKIENLPQLARLSKGRNNGDCTFSLKPDDLSGVVYLPPAGADGSPVTLTVRVINIDEDNATTLALIDLLVPSEPISEAGATPILHVVETPEGTEPATGGEPAEAASLQAVHVKPVNAAETETHSARDAARKALEDEITQLRQQLETATTEGEEPRKLALEAAEADHARIFVEQLAAAKEEMEKEFTGRLEEALSQAEQIVAAQEAAAKKKAEETETAHNRALTEAKKAFEDNISSLQLQLDAASVGTEEVRKQALEAAETAHAQALEKQAAAIQQRLERESAERLAEALRQAEEKAEAALTSTRETWMAAEAERLVAATQAFDDELAQLQKQPDAAAVDIEEVRKQATEAAATAHAAEIAALKSTHAKALEEQAAAAGESLGSEDEKRLAEALRQAKENAETALATARETWMAEEAERLVAATKAHEDELAQLQKQPDAAAVDIEEVRKEATEAAATAHAAEIAALKSAHAKALEEQAGAAGEPPAHDVEERLAEALRQAEEKAETALATAREIWKAEEAERLMAATKVFGDELAQLQKQAGAAGLDIEEVRKQATEAAATAHAAEIAALKSTHAKALEEQAGAAGGPLGSADKDRLAEATRLAEENAEKKAEERLIKARQFWEAETKATLAAAHETWKAEAAGQRKTKMPKSYSRKAKGPSRRARAYRAPRDWVPRRSRVVAVMIIGLVALVMLRPDLKSRVIEYSAPAIAEIRVRAEPLIASALALVQPSGPTTRPVVVGERATVGAVSANVRAGPSTGANVIKALPRGSEVTVLASQQGWRRIRFGNGTNDVGWVSGNLLSN